jgi:RNA polymerase sigma-70 factor, ECF subfamily
MAHFLRGIHRDQQELLAQAVARAKARDMGAIRFLYVRMADEVVACIRGVIPDPAEADALARAVFAELPTTIQAYEPRDLPFRAWLLGVARSAAVELSRAPGRAPSNGHVPALPEPAPASDPLRDAVWRMRSEERDVLVLRHVVGMSTVDIAKRLGRREDAIKGLEYRGRAALEQATAELEAAPAVA